MSELPPTDSGAQLFELRVKAASENFTISVGSDEQVRRLEIQSTPGDEIVVPLVSQEDLRSNGLVTVESPNEVLAVTAVRSFENPAWSSAMARPVEDPDVLAPSAAHSVRLAEGWCPRELVHGEAVRWIGSEVYFEFDPSAVSKLHISGIVGPCLGRGASAEFYSLGERVAEQPLDLEDGQPCLLEVDLRNVRTDGHLLMKLNRPKPRFTVHDARVLNILVRQVELV